VIVQGQVAALSTEPFVVANALAFKRGFWLILSIDALATANGSVLELTGKLSFFGAAGFLKTLSRTIH
jgi:hypothetical protein